LEKLQTDSIDPIYSIAQSLLTVNSSLTNTYLLRTEYFMKNLTKVGVLQLSIAAAVSAIATIGSAPAHAVSFVSTFRPPGATTEVGRVDPTTGAYTTYGTYGLQLTDIAIDNAGTIYGSTYDQLYILGPGSGNTSGAVNTISLANFGFNGLAFDNNNNLYGLAGNNPRTGGAGTPGFYSINPATGAATLISNLSGTNLGSAATGLAPTAFGFAGTISTGDTSDLAFNPTTNNFFAVTGNDNAQLFTIDPTTGATTRIGTGTGYGFIAGLTYDGGVLRGYDISKRQIVIDPITGIGALSPLALTGINVLADGSNSLIGGAASTPTAIPEPLTIVGTTIGAVSAWKIRKRLKATNNL
jgi:hypothetical protein